MKPTNPQPQPQPSTSGLINPQEGNPNARFLIRQIDRQLGEISTRPIEVDWLDWLRFANRTAQNAIDSDLIPTSTGTLLLISQPSGEIIFMYDCVIGSGWLPDLELATLRRTAQPEPEPSSSIVGLLRDLATQI